MTVANPDTDTEWDRQIRLVYRDWWETCATIRGRDGEMIHATDGALQANELQAKIDEVVEWCELNDEPCRMIVLKPRKEGATTFLVGKSYHLARSSQAHLLQIGDQLQTTQTMWDILRTYQDEDAFDAWGGALSRMTASAAQGHAKWSHGSTAWTETAGDKRAGQSKTPTIIHAEEVAHWGKDGSAANASDIMLALLNSIADEPQTYVFISSTANGVGGWYHRTYEGSVSLEERKQGNKGNGWIRVFLPWHKSRWGRQPVTDIEREQIATTLTDAERAGIAQFDWSAEQMAWRRAQIAAKCDGDESKFSQENPSDQISCFLSSGNPRFHQVGLARLSKMAEMGHGLAKIGTIQEHRGNFTFMPDEKGWLWMSEEPRPGLSYAMGGDPMTGIQSAGAKERDNHAVPVVREAYTDANLVHHPTELVAAIYVEGGCQWDIDVLAERMWRLASFYGRCVCVPEANNAGMELIAQLIALDVDVWQREDMDHIHPGKKLKKPGYWTGPGKSGTRNAWVERMAEVIRECSGDPGTEVFVCKFKPAVQEMGYFVRNTDGSCAATPGKRDDWVAAIGIVLRVGCYSRMPMPVPVESYQDYQAMTTRNRCVA